MPSDIGAEAVDKFATHALEGDEPSAWNLASTMLAHLPPTIILRDLVGRGQEEVGIRWQTGRCTVQQEHTATAVSTHVIKRLSKEMAPSRRRAEVVLLLAAEGDWHSLSALMVNVTLASDGWSVVQVPAGTTAGQLAAVIHDHGPVAVVVTCSMPALLPGARRIVMASQDAGTPAIVGGRAFGSDPQRAQQIDANGWSHDLVGVSGIVAAHAGFSAPSARLDHAAASEYSLLRSELRDITAAIQDTIPDRVQGDREEQIGAALWILRSLAASLLCDDSRILAEDVAWTRSRSEAGAPRLEPILELLIEHLPQELTLARQLLAAAA